MSPHSLGVYFEEKGLLHDCSLSLRESGRSSLVLFIQDVNLAFKGLPEYEGAASCLVQLDGVTDVEMVGNAASQKVYEASAEAVAQGAPEGTLLVTFWPEGSLKLKFSIATVTEEATL